MRSMRRHRLDETRRPARGRRGRRGAGAPAAAGASTGDTSTRAVRGDRGAASAVADRATAAGRRPAGAFDPGGTGTGPAAAPAGIARAHGGDVCRSRAGKRVWASRFPWRWLTRNDRADLQSSTTTRRSRTYLQTLLGSRGYAVDVYTQRRGAARGHCGAGAAPNVVLLDVLMPGLDGLETLRADPAARIPAAQVIMLSGRQAPATIVDAVRLGAADYVVKPDDPEGVGEAALEAAIRNALERESLNAEVARLQRAAGRGSRGRAAVLELGPGDAPVMAMVERVADSDVSVLLRGESGVGKEVIARELHRRSAAAHQAVRQGELRGAAGRSARKRAVRPRARRLHRRRQRRASASSSSRSTAPSCSTRSARCRRRCRPSCCTSCRTASSRGSAATGRSRSTCASSPRPIATSRR